MFLLLVSAKQAYVVQHFFRTNERAIAFGASICLLLLRFVCYCRFASVLLPGFLRGIIVASALASSDGHVASFVGFMDV